MMSHLETRVDSRVGKLICRHGTVYTGSERERDREVKWEHQGSQPQRVDDPRFWHLAVGRYKLISPKRRSMSRSPLATFRLGVHVQDL